MAAGGIPDESLSRHLECCICSDQMLDPRCLPCGHSFCGPPRKCLEGLETSGAIKCAVCNSEHNLKASDLKPLYGIRDAISGLSQVRVAEKRKKDIDYLPVCETHDMKCTFWCSDCNEALCEDCVDENHTDHNLKRLAHILRAKIGAALEQLELLSSTRNVTFIEKSKKNSVDQIEFLKTVTEECEKRISDFEDILATIESLGEEEINVLRKFSKGDKELDIESSLVKSSLRLLKTTEQDIRTCAPKNVMVHAALGAGSPVKFIIGNFILIIDLTIGQYGVCCPLVKCCAVNQITGPWSVAFYIALSPSGATTDCNETCCTRRMYPVFDSKWPFRESGSGPLGRCFSKLDDGSIKMIMQLAITNEVYGRRDSLVYHTPDTFSLDYLLD